MPAYRFEAFEGKKVLIKGDIGSGKTTITASLLRQAARRTPPSMITVIDMAPSYRVKGKRVIGRRLLSSSTAPPRVSYLCPAKVWAPRLNGRTKQEVLRFAKANANAIGRLLEHYLQAATRILFVNDLTLYLHAGSLTTLLEAIKAAGTFIGNAYHNSYFADDRGSGVTTREQRLLAKLERHMDIVITLQP